MFRKMQSLRVGLPLPLAALERSVAHGSVSNSTFASSLNLPGYDFSRIPRRLVVSASTNSRLFGDTGLFTAATTAFHGQWLVAWAVNLSPCTSQGLCAVSGRRLSANFRRRQHRLLATRPHRERRAALADHRHGRPPAGALVLVAPTVREDNDGAEDQRIISGCKDVPKEGKRYEQDRQVRG